MKVETLQELGIFCKYPCKCFLIKEISTKKVLLEKLFFIIQYHLIPPNTTIKVNVFSSMRVG